MKVKFYGTRGSIPVCHPDFMEFGGNTTCLRIEFNDGRFAIMDAGTGIRELGHEIMSGEQQVDDLYIAFSHFHWDHIQGFPFFSPAYDPKMTINILALGHGREISSLEEVFATQMQKQYFPVQLENMGARFNFLLPNKKVEIFGDIVAQAHRHNHPGGAYSYRLTDSDGRSVAFCTDVEHGDSINEDFVEFCRGADLLIHDAQYTADELLSHRGWGHSTFDQALEVAERAGIERLIMTHHDPSHSDAFLKGMEEKYSNRLQEVILARERMIVTV